MNKTIKMMMIAGLACVAMCGTANAAPGGHQAGRAPEPRRMVQQTRKPAPKPVANHRPAPKPVVHAPPPPRVVHHQPVRRPTTPCHRHHRHDCHDCHYDDNGWIELGAGIIGGIIGALIAG